MALLLALSLIFPAPASALRPAGLEESNEETRNAFVTQLTVVPSPAAGLEELLVKLAKKPAISLEDINRVYAEVKGLPAPSSRMYGVLGAERLGDLLSWLNASPKERLDWKRYRYMDNFILNFKEWGFNPEDPIKRAAFTHWVVTAAFIPFETHNHRTGWALMNLLLLRDGVLTRPLQWKPEWKNDYMAALDFIHSDSSPHNMIRFLKSCFLDMPAGLEEAGVRVVDEVNGTGVVIPRRGLLADWYTAWDGVEVPSSLLGILDPKRERIIAPAADISTQTTVFVQRGVLPGRVVDALEAAGVRVEQFDLENVPAADPERENVYLLDVPIGSERREWVPDSNAIVINFRSGSAGNRPDSPEELGALINVAREADGRILRVGAIYRSDLHNDLIAIDTQL